MKKVKDVMKPCNIYFMDPQWEFSKALHVK